MAKKHLPVSRRKFLAGVAVAGAATAASSAKAATSASSNAPVRTPSALPPTAHMAAAESGTPNELSNSRIGGVPGSDFMVESSRRSTSNTRPQTVLPATAAFMNP